jgi:hypothetical protein
MKNYFSKTMPVILITCLFSGNIFAQGLYVNAHTGYALGISQYNISNYTETATSNSYDRAGLSFGKGVNLGCTVGYMFSKNLGIELGLSYLMGNKTTGTNTYIDHIDADTYSATMARLNPSVVVAAGFDKVNPYAKLGVIVGAGSFTHNYNETYTNGNAYITDYKWNGGLAVGFTSALGASFKLNNKLSLFGEFNLISLSYAPKKMVIVTATDNGKDVLEEMTTYDTETDFVNSYSKDKNSPVDYTKPNQGIRVSYPFGSFGFNVGVRINLAKYMNEVRKSTH